MDSYADEDAPRGGGFDPHQLWRMFVRRKWLFIVPFFVCLGMAAVAIKTQAPIFFSSAQIHVIQESTTARSLPQESRYPARGNPDAETFALIQTIVTGPRFLEAIVRDQELDRRAREAGLVGPAPPGMSDEQWRERVVRGLARELEEQIRVRQEGVRLFGIGVRAGDPDQAYELARAVLDRFLAEERANRLQPSSSTRDFLEGQRTIYQTQLDEAETRLTDFQRTIVSETLAGNPINADNLTRAEGALSRLRGQAVDAGAADLLDLERQVREVIATPPAMTSYLSDPDVAAAVRELQNLVYDEAIGELGGAGAARPAAGAGDAMGTARLNLGRLVDIRTTEAYPQANALGRTRIAAYAYRLLEREATQRAAQRLERNVQEFRGFMARQPVQSAQLTSLQQEVTRLRELLQRLETDISAENLRLAANMSEIGYRVVVRRDPQRPFAPIEPNKLRLAFLGFALALAMGCGLVILAELLDRSFKSIPDLERELGLKVIGTLPLIETRLFGNRRARHPWVWAILVISILIVAAIGLLFLYPRLS